MADPRPSGYVGWFGAYKSVTVDLNLGMGTRRGHPKFGLRRAVWDAAMGYVSGFPKRDILYFVLTRSLSHRVMVWAMTREGIEFRDGVPVAASANTKARIELARNAALAEVYGPTWSSAGAEEKE